MSTSTPITAKPPMTVELAWQGDLVFTGTVGDLSMTLDGRAKAGPSPMHAVAFGLSGCMAIDVANILTRGRHPFTAIAARLDAHRADAQPSRFTRMDLHYTVTGHVPPDAVARAIELSREKYCSVLHSLRQDIEFNTSFDVVAG
jgi:putative redox protein